MIWWLLLAGSFLKVWRRAGIDEPLDTWEYIRAAMSQPMKHLSVEEAIERARQSGYLSESYYSANYSQLPPGIQMRIEGKPELVAMGRRAYNIW